MTDEDALLAAVAAAPDDDAPRLAYADWLDEHGRPDRAEFIRVQCRIARGAAAFGDEERAFELEEVNRGRWLVGLPGGEGVVWTFRRGFPEVVEAPIDVFLDRYDRFVAVPWVRDLRLWDVRNPALRDFCTRDWRPHWVELELTANPSLASAWYNFDPGLGTLAGSEQVRQLRALWLRNFGWGDEAIQVFAASENLAGLRVLGIDEVVSDSDEFALLLDRFGDRLVLRG